VSHGAEVVDAEGRRWRAFAPGWRLWLWLGFLVRRVVLFRPPGRLLPFVGWAPSARVDMTVGMPPRRVRLRAERVEADPLRRTRARMRRVLRRMDRSSRKGRSGS
jgi:hypothetical protein